MPWRPNAASVPSAVAAFHIFTGIVATSISNEPIVLTMPPALSIVILGSLFGHRKSSFQGVRRRVRPGTPRDAATVVSGPDRMPPA